MQQTKWLFPTASFNTAEYDKLLKNPKELIKALDDGFGGTSSSTYKKAFEEITNYELAGVTVEITAYSIWNGIVYALTKAKQLIPTPGKPDTFEAQLKEQGIKVKAATNQQIRVLTLKKPIHMAIPADKIMQLEKDGAK